MVYGLWTALVVGRAEAAWVWSPRTGWVGPSGAVKDSPEEQLAFARGLFEQREYERAGKEFRKLLKAYQASAEAPEAQYYLGRCAEEEGDYYRAFVEYRKTLQTYPSTTRFEELLEREYRLGNLFLGGAKRKLLGKAAIWPARDKAVEIFRAIAEDGPFTDYGQLAQYQLGLSHLALKDYEASVSAFEEMIVKYPESSLVDDARFQIAQASLKGTFRSGYDQAPTALAVRELQTFLREYPESELASEGGRRVIELTERWAQHEYDIGQFYERRRQPAAALIYYETIASRFGQTSWAPKAVAKIQLLQPAAP
jgi:outer membrane protein assembly factor BamD (BamD/ComL family)